MTPTMSLIHPHHISSFVDFQGQAREGFNEESGPPLSFSQEKRDFSTRGAGKPSPCSVGRSSSSPSSPTSNHPTVSPVAHSDMYSPHLPARLEQRSGNASVFTGEMFPFTPEIWRAATGGWRKNDPPRAEMFVVNPSSQPVTRQQTAGHFAPFLLSQSFPVNYPPSLVPFSHHPSTGGISPRYYSSLSPHHIKSPHEEVTVRSSPVPTERPTTPVMKDASLPRLYNEQLNAGKQNFPFEKSHAYSHIPSLPMSAVTYSLPSLPCVPCQHFSRGTINAPPRTPSAVLSRQFLSESVRDRQTVPLSSKQDEKVKTSTRQSASSLPASPRNTEVASFLPTSASVNHEVSSSMPALADSTGVEDSSNEFTKNVYARKVFSAPVMAIIDSFSSPSNIPSAIDSFSSSSNIPNAMVAFGETSKMDAVSNSVSSVTENFYVTPLSATDNLESVPTIEPYNSRNSTVSSMNSLFADETANSIAYAGRATSSTCSYPPVSPPLDWTVTEDVSGTTCPPARLSPQTQNCVGLTSSSELSMLEQCTFSLSNSSCSSLVDASNCQKVLTLPPQESISGDAEKFRNYDVPGSPPFSGTEMNEKNQRNNIPLKSRPELLLYRPKALRKKKQSSMDMLTTAEIPSYLLAAQKMMEKKSEAHTCTTDASMASLVSSYQEKAVPPPDHSNQEKYVTSFSEDFSENASIAGGSGERYASLPIETESPLSYQGRKNTLECLSLSSRPRMSLSITTSRQQQDDLDDFSDKSELTDRKMINKRGPAINGDMKPSQSTLCRTPKLPSGAELHNRMYGEIMHRVNLHLRSNAIPKKNASSARESFNTKKSEEIAGRRQTVYEGRKTMNGPAALVIAARRDTAFYRRSAA